MTKRINWDRSLYGIAVAYEPRVVRIRIEPVLIEFLRRPDDGAPILAEAIRRHYETLFHTPLGVSRDSLAIEILGHTYIDVVLEAVERLALGDPVRRAVARIKSSTEVIDCGEKDVDGNRFVWDALEPFADVIYGILGDRA